MGHTAILAHPVCFLLTAVKVGILQDRFIMLSADRVGDFSELVMVGHMVFKLPSGLEGNRVLDLFVSRITRGEVGAGTAIFAGRHSGFLFEDI